VFARNDLEGLLVEIWEKTLQRSPIGIEDNFFDLGGHSLLALKLAAQIGQALAKEIPVSLIFRCPTIKELAEAIRGIQ
jgi:acyl carrier protein